MGVAHMKIMGLAGLVAFAILLPDNSNAMDANAQAKALMTISDFAERICNTISHEGSSTSVELSGKGKAQLSEVVKRLADLGFDGSGKYSSTEYKNVLQSDLAKALKDNATCKEHVFELLNDKMVSGIAMEGNVVNGNNNVMSSGQTGGITANTVTIAPPQRHLGNAERAQLLALIPAGSKVRVGAAAGDSEAYQFASEIFSYLKAQNYNPSGVDGIMTVPPLVGQQVIKPTETNGEYSIQIGGQR